MINETRVALRGNVATDPVLKVTSQGTTVCSFRLAVTTRRWSSAENRMVDVESSFYTVTCWRSLAENTAASVKRGQGVLVQGRLRVRDFVHDEQPRTSADLTADSVGLDLQWGTAELVPSRRSRPEEDGQDADRDEADELAVAVSAGAVSAATVSAVDVPEGEQLQPVGDPF